MVHKACALRVKALECLVLKDRQGKANTRLNNKTPVRRNVSVIRAYIHSLHTIQDSSEKEKSRNKSGSLLCIGLFDIQNIRASRK